MSPKAVTIIGFRFSGTSHRQSERSDLRSIPSVFARKCEGTGICCVVVRTGCFLSSSDCCVRCPLTYFFQKNRAFFHHGQNILISPVFSMAQSKRRRTSGSRLFTLGSQR